LQFAGNARGELRLDDFEIVFGQRGRKLVVREQLHAAFKMFRQDLQRKIRARRFVRADVVERLLEREPVERFGAVGKKLSSASSTPSLPSGICTFALFFTRP
jgi:hypothetical protein